MRETPQDQFEQEQEKLNRLAFVQLNTKSTTQGAQRTLNHHSAIPWIRKGGITRSGLYFENERMGLGASPTNGFALSNFSLRHPCQVNTALIIQQPYVKMCSTGGQRAWLSIDFQSEGYQRLHAEVHKQNANNEKEKLRNYCVSPACHSNSFYEWLVGFTEGDGSFFIQRQPINKNRSKWAIGFKIALSSYNYRALAYIKSKLGVGHIGLDKGSNMLQYRVRNRKHLSEHIFPIFDKYPMISAKNYDFLRVKEAYKILENNLLDSNEKEAQLIQIHGVKLSQDPTIVSPVWEQTLGKKRMQELKQDQFLSLRYDEACQLITPNWLAGFTEADGSFYFVCKDRHNLRLCHAYGITQSPNPLLLKTIRIRLRIKQQVKFRVPQNSSFAYWCLETTNNRSIETISKLLTGKLWGMKAVEFRIWQNALKYRRNFEKLSKIQAQMRKLRSYRVQAAVSDL